MLLTYTINYAKKLVKKFDPCVIDVFMSAIDFMEGGEPSAWWEFTNERKKYDLPISDNICINV